MLAMEGGGEGEGEGGQGENLHDDHEHTHAQEEGRGQEQHQPQEIQQDQEQDQEQEHAPEEQEHAPEEQEHAPEEQEQEQEHAPEEQEQEQEHAPEEQDQEQEHAPEEQEHAPEEQEQEQEHAPEQQELQEQQRQRADEKQEQADEQELGEEQEQPDEQREEKEQEQQHEPEQEEQEQQEQEQRRDPVQEQGHKQEQQQEGEAQQQGQYHTQPKQEDQQQAPMVVVSNHEQPTAADDMVVEMESFENLVEVAEDTEALAEEAQESSILQDTEEQMAGNAQEYENPRASTAGSQHFDQPSEDFDVELNPDELDSILDSYNLTEGLIDERNEDFSAAFDEGDGNTEVMQIDLAHDQLGEARDLNTSEPMIVPASSVELKQTIPEQKVEEQWVHASEGAASLTTSTAENDSKTPNEHEEMIYAKDALLQGAILLHMQVFALQHSQLRRLFKQYDATQVTQSPFVIQNIDRWLVKRMESDPQPKNLNRLIDDIEMTLLGLLDSSGSLSMSASVDSFVVLMSRIHKLDHMVLTLTVLKNTSTDASKDHFVKARGLRLLQDWIVLGRQKDNVSLLKLILETLQTLPFNKEAVMEAGIGKSIKKLTRYTSKEHDVEGLTAAAQVLMQSWVQLAKIQIASEAAAVPVNYPPVVYQLHSKLLQQRGIPGQYADVEGDDVVESTDVDDLLTTPSEENRQIHTPAQQNEIIQDGDSAISKQEGKREPKARGLRPPPSRKIQFLPQSSLSQKAHQENEPQISQNAPESTTAEQNSSMAHPLAPAVNEPKKVRWADERGKKLTQIAEIEVENITRNTASYRDRTHRDLAKQERDMERSHMKKTKSTLDTKSISSSSSSSSSGSSSQDSKGPSANQRAQIPWRTPRTLPPSACATAPPRNSTERLRQIARIDSTPEVVFLDEVPPNPSKNVAHTLHNSSLVRYIAFEYGQPPLVPPVSQINADHSLRDRDSSEVGQSKRRRADGSPSQDEPTTKAVRLDPDQDGRSPPPRESSDDKQVHTNQEQISQENALELVPESLRSLPPEVLQILCDENHLRAILDENGSIDQQKLEILLEGYAKLSEELSSSAPPSNVESPLSTPSKPAAARPHNDDQERSDDHYGTSSLPANDGYLEQQPVPQTSTHERPDGHYSTSSLPAHDDYQEYDPEYSNQRWVDGSSPQRVGYAREHSPLADEQQGRKRSRSPDYIPKSVSYAYAREPFTDDIDAERDNARIDDARPPPSLYWDSRDPMRNALPVANVMPTDMYWMPQDPAMGMLRSADNRGRVPVPCKFFNSRGGCKHGAACRFDHVLVGNGYRVDEALSDMDMRHRR